jgi:CRISPR-associated protein Cmr3
MTKYLVSFLPVGNFYFGGEHGFDSDDRKNYLVHSNPFPQQTTILGALRYAILQANDALTPVGGSPFNGKNIKEIESLIGAKSFDKNFVGNEQNKEQSFGIIQSLSPVFLIKDKETVLLPKPKTEDFKFVASNNNGGTFLTQKNENTIFDLEKYKAKKGYERRFTNTTDKQEDIFIENRQIGILKNNRNDDNREGFYKQTFYRLKDKHAFGCIVTVNNEEEWEKIPKKQILRMGGDHSYFQLIYQKASDDILKQMTPQYSNEEGDSIVLLSNAYVENDIFQHCSFIFGESVDARFMQTNQETIYHNDLPNDLPKNKEKQKTALKKTKKLSLLERGSVLFVKDMTKVKACLDKNNWKNIGYNHYIIH